jgi:hypothetical protein
MLSALKYALFFISLLFAASSYASCQPAPMHSVGMSQEAWDQMLAEASGEFVIFNPAGDHYDLALCVEYYDLENPWQNESMEYEYCYVPGSSRPGLKNPADWILPQGTYIFNVTRFHAFPPDGPDETFTAWSLWGPYALDTPWYQDAYGQGSKMYITIDPFALIGDMMLTDWVPGEASCHPKLKCGFPISREELTSIVWQFGRSDGSKIGKMRLLEDGSFSGYSHRNENSWAIVGDELLFYNEKGDVSTRFSTFEQHDGKWVISGPFLLAGSITHVLEQISDNAH